MSSNPFEAPSYNSDVASESTDGEVLAGRFTRFAAAFADGLLILLVVLPVQYFSGYFERAAAQSLTIPEQLIMTLLYPLMQLILNGFPLAGRGQTIGKILSGIQIIGVNSSGLLPFFKVFVLRYLWLLPVNLVAVFVPVPAMGLFIGVIGLLDALLIFGGDRRCLHDYIAGSRVVMYKEGRKKMA